MRRRAARELSASVVALLGMTGLAAAQNQLPGPAQPPQLQERFRPTPLPPSGDGAPAMPMPQQPAPPGSEAVRFRLSAIRLDGVTAYQSAAFEAFYAGMIGRETTFAEMIDLANRLTILYRADGYLLSQVVVPEQRVENGIVRLVAVEGFIDRVLFDGDAGSAQGLLDAFAARIKAARPLTAAALERNLLLIGDLPGVNVQAVIEPSPSTFGAADLRVVIRQRKVEGFVSLDNRGSRFAGPWTLAVGGSALSVFGGSEQIDVLGATSPGTGELLYGQGQLTLPVGPDDSGDTLQLFAGGGRVRPDIAAQLFPFDSRATSFEGRVTYARPFWRSRTENLTGRISGIWRDNTTRLTDLPSDDRNPTRDHVRLAQLRATYDIADRWLGVNLVDVALNKGLGILGASKSSDRVSRQTGADGSFTYVNATLSRLQGLGGGFAVHFEANGQYSFDPLLPSERFGVGGAKFGRGFPPGDITGDHGISFKIEPRWGDHVGDRLLTSYQLYAFVDAGRTWDAGHTPHVQDDLVAAGAGIRLNITDHLSINPEIAHQVSGTAADQRRREHETRFLITTVARF